MRMLSAALRRNRCHCTLQDLQKCLLNTFTGNISCNRDILGLLRDLVDLIDINNTSFGFLNVIICCLNQFQQNILHIFTDITCFCQSCCICDSKWYIQNLSQCLCQKCFAGTGRSYHNNIALLQFHIIAGVGCDSLVMIINSDG